MKFIFFLIPILIISLFGVTDSFAEKGINYDDIKISTNPDGSEVHKWTTVPERILIDNVYQDFRFTDTVNFLTVETGHGTVQLDKNTCSFNFYKKGILDNNPLFSDSIVPKIATISTENWSNIPSITAATCEPSWDGTQLVAKKFVSGVGLMEYKYINTGKTWKTQLEATNLSALTNKKFGFTQTINLNRDTIHYDGTVKNLDSLNNTTFDRNWLETHQSKVVDLLNDVSFDFDLGFDNLKSVIVYDTGLNKSKLSFNYLYDNTVILPNEKLVIDPVYTTSATDSYEVRTAAPGVSVNCPTTASVITPGNTQLYLEPSASGLNFCDVSSMRFDVTAIPDSIVQVTNSSWSFAFTTVGNGQNCDVNELTHDPTTVNPTTLWNDILNTANGTTFLNNNAWCTVAGSKNLDLGAGADSSFKSVINSGNNIISIGYAFDSMTRDGVYHEVAGFSNNQLTITYVVTASPWAVTDLASTLTTTTRVYLDWTQPYLGGGNQALIGYQINKTTPQTNNPLVSTNSTGNSTSAFTFTGLTPATSYSFRVSAWTNNTGGHPFNNATGNVFNVTTSSNPINCCAPTSLVASSTTVTTIDLNWVASTLLNLNGYKIEKQIPPSTAWTTVGTGNTSSTAVTYTETGLTKNIIYNYRVYGLNGTGQSLVSNEYAMTTFHKPNAVSPLTATADAFTSVILTWTPPVSYAPSITDYQVNYTTPLGIPQSIFVHGTPITASPTTVTGLAVGESYSFRISAITVHGKNATGQIANSTTVTIFDPSNLSDPDTTNTDDFQIFYTKTITNSSQILLDVTYPGSFTLTCNMLSKFSGDNNTYTGLTETATTNYGNDTGTVKSSFIFNGLNTEVINVNCYNGTNPTGEHSAKYIITISQFELLNQIAHFRDGTYGTSGQFGGIDLITLLIVIIGMIGFNRVTPIAGVLFTVITVGVAAYFEIIEYYQIMFPALALIVLLAYTRTRQNDG